MTYIYYTMLSVAIIVWAFFAGWTMATGRAYDRYNRLLDRYDNLQALVTKHSLKWDWPDA